MSTPEISKIADAIVALINDEGTFSQSFTATRVMFPPKKAVEDNTLSVYVVPRSRTPEPSTRMSVQYDYEIDVGVVKRILAPTNDTVDAELWLLEELSEFLRLKQLSTYRSAKWIDEDSDPIYSEEVLRVDNTFVGFITLRYRVVH